MGYDVSIHRVRRYKPCDGFGGDEIVHNEYIYNGSLTFNYSPLYRLCGVTIRDFDGAALDEVHDRLCGLVTQLGTNRYEKDPWAPTPGNAGAAIEEWLIFIDRALAVDNEKRNIFFRLLG